MNVLTNFPKTLAGACLVLSSLTALAQDGPVRTPYEIVPTRVFGETCVEDPNNKDLKCLSLQPTDTTLMPVVQRSLRIGGGESVLVQFCAKVEDKDFQELECQVELDGAVTPPGSLKPNENPNNMIYSFCFSWAGKAMASSDRSRTRVEVLCQRKGTDADTEVNINDYTLSVFARGEPLR